MYSNWEKYNYADDTDLLFLALSLIAQTDEHIKIEDSYTKVIKPIEKKLTERAAQNYRLSE